MGAIALDLARCLAILIPSACKQTGSAMPSLLPTAEPSASFFPASAEQDPGGAGTKGIPAGARRLEPAARVRTATGRAPPNLQSVV
jgi:hypothetical protein